ncbi:HD domain-containing protein [Danxiaibacter flavus]|uniref:HD domain-containing protein n=1 Tax=Danxiaibacter flavus TaxID=3049108 RepID=A0ABV3ZBJ2_9BACT|nr:HD domain-containing protein [Chitinophagaceae bacterium DXS]
MTKDPVLIQQKVDELFSLYDKYGDEDYGEGVTQLMHMIQCAKLALSEQADNDMVLAAFFHDIGHFLEHAEDMGGYGRKDHDKLGRDYLLEHGFSDKIADLVASHVETKRYLTYAEDGYYDKLSDASKMTLKYQGGPMTEDEAAAYAKDPLLESYIKIRHWDDLGKDTETPVDPKDVEMMKHLTFEYLMSRA